MSSFNFKAEQIRNIVAKEPSARTEAETDFLAGWLAGEVKFLKGDKLQDDQLRQVS